MLIKRFTETAVLPRRATEGSAGYDLSADLSQPEVIQPGESKLLPTGIGVALPPQTAGLVFGRSGLGAKHGIVPANAVGVIDWDYRGEIKVPLRNQGSEPYTVQPGDIAGFKSDRQPCHDSGKCQRCRQQQPGGFRPEDPFDFQSK